MKLCDVRRRYRFVRFQKFMRRINASDASRIHQRDARSQQKRFVNVMRHDNNRLPKFSLQFAELLMQLDHGVDSDVLICADDPEAKRVASDLVAMLPGARAVDAGPLRNGRLIENVVSLLIAINRRNKVKHSGIRITGL